MIWRRCPTCGALHNPADHDLAWPFLCHACGVKLQFMPDGHLAVIEGVMQYLPQQNQMAVAFWQDKVNGAGRAGLMPSLYLWCGIGAIEDLEVLDLDDALRILREKTFGDWALWYREGMTSKLIAVHKTATGEVHVFVPEAK